MPKANNITQYLCQLIKEGRLKITEEYKKKVTYHDPCYLGRHNGIYDEPREILKKIPGLELKEMADTRENSLCCGMGGGRIWMETAKNERFSDIRLKQASGYRSGSTGDGLPVLHHPIRGQQAVNAETARLSRLRILRRFSRKSFDDRISDKDKKWKKNRSTNFGRVSRGVISGM